MIKIVGEIFLKNRIKIRSKSIKLFYVDVIVKVFLEVIKLSECDKLLEVKASQIRK